MPQQATAVEKQYSLPTPYQQYIFISRYARWLNEEKRRETWTETVGRYISFFQKQMTPRIKANDPIWEELRDAIGNLEIMPSMRTLMTAGEALERDNVAGYNCAYLAIDNTRAFDEILYILMCGTGVGFSVEQKYVDQLPIIAEDFHDTDTTIVVADSKLGWAKGFKELVHLLYGGQVPKYDMSKVRAAGEPLKTFGGRASGPEPLEQLFKFAIKLFKNAAGRRLTTLEAHDLVCMIATCVVVGGVRRCCKDTYDIYTDSGWKNIKDVNVGDYVIINGERVAVKANINNGIQQTVNVNMEDGTTHICTPEHRWFVYDHATETTQWKTTEELKNGRFSMLKPKSTLP